MKKHIPNIITCCNLICGCIAVGAAFQNPIPVNYFWAIVFILLGAIFDFFDGMVARALGVSSPIGKELDSLADVVTFGVAPPLGLSCLSTSIPRSRPTAIDCAAKASFASMISKSSIFMPVFSITFLVE